MTVRSYAKINLGLRLLRKRPDGYHDLETVFHRIEMHDELSFRLTDGTVSLETDRKDLPTDSSNLCIKAAEYMRSRAPAGSGVAMRLRKGIPIGAGLGGGSSDAATVLLALNDLWSVKASADQLKSDALRLGSDVPFFLSEGSAAATGRGDLLEVLPVEMPYWIVVAVPPVAVSTAWAYANVRLRSVAPSVSLKEVMTRSLRDWKVLRSQLTNDFESTVIASHPAIGKAKQHLLDGGALVALMSGSGSAVFGLFAEEPAALAVSADFETQGYVVSVTAPGFSPPVPHILTTETDP